MNWTNQDLILYHGTILVHARSIMADGVDVTHGDADLDFGRGFYCTTLLKQASDWSRRKAYRLGGAPAVVRLSVSRDELAALEVLSFVAGSSEAEDFWGLVAYCRNGGIPHARAGLRPGYDVVFGPVAIWKTRRAMPDADQVSFHTPAAQNLLNIPSRRSIV